MLSDMLTARAALQCLAPRNELTPPCIVNVCSYVPATLRSSHNVDQLQAERYLFVSFRNITS